MALLAAAILAAGCASASRSRPRPDAPAPPFRTRPDATPQRAPSAAPPAERAERIERAPPAGRPGAGAGAEAGGTSVAEGRPPVEYLPERVIANAVGLELAGRFEEAIESLEGLAETARSQGDGATAARAGALVELLERFTAAAGLEPDDPLGAAAEFDSAMALLEHLREADREYWKTRAGLLEGDIDALLDAFEERTFAEFVARHDALARVHRFAPALRFLLGVALEATGNAARAGDVYETVVAELSSEKGVARTAAGARGPRIQRLLREVAVEAESRTADVAYGGVAPFEVALAALCWRNGLLAPAARAWERAYRGSPGEVDLLVQAGAAYRHANEEKNAVRVYREMWGLLQEAPATVAPAVNRRTVRRALEDLGHIERHGAWVRREFFMIQEGWVPYQGAWLRPEEARFREVIEVLEQSDTPEELRTLATGEYSEAAAAGELRLGMNRRELTTAWGFFDDQETLERRPGPTPVVYEALHFGDGRHAFLRDGLVCFWIE